MIASDLWIGRKIRKKLTTGAVTEGTIDYIHPSGRWYTAEFTFANGNKYKECFWTQELKDPYEERDRRRAERRRRKQQQTGEDISI